MSETKAVCLIVVGCALAIVAVLNQHFYWRKGWFSGEIEAPRWAGRLAFGFVGALCILVGITHLLHGS